MLIRVKYAGYQGTEQVAAGDYLALFSDGSHKLMAAVRYVKLVQCGHWMMGRMRIGGTTFTVSGPIGNDGLPINASADGSVLKVGNHNPIDQKFLTPVPEDLVERYWANTDGWNDLGSMTQPLREWALKTFPPTKRMQ